MSNSQAWRTTAWSAGWIAFMAAIAWGIRWEPRLAYSLEKTSFYLETPVERQDGTMEPPVINCAVTGRATNLSRGTLWADQVLPAEWDPPIDEEQSFLNPNFTPVTPRTSLPRQGFRHVPGGAAKVRFRFRTFLVRPNPWKDWLSAHLPPLCPLWLEQLSTSRQTRLIHSDWFEADVPDPQSLAETEN
jgi:hypothetical protein